MTWQEGEGTALGHLVITRFLEERGRGTGAAERRKTPDWEMGVEP